MGESAGGVHRRVLLSFDFGDLVDVKPGGFAPPDPPSPSLGGPHTPLRSGGRAFGAPMPDQPAAFTAACCCRSISAIWSIRR